MTQKSLQRPSGAPERPVRKIRRSNEHAVVQKPFRFLGLPGEQRNQIYRYLLDDITFISKEFRVWDRRVPRYKGKLKAYATLIRTCKTLKHEVKTIFEAEYLPKMTFYFDDMLTFLGSCGPDVRNSLMTSSATFVLKTPITSMHSDIFPGTLTMSLMTSPYFSDILLPRRTKRPFYSRSPNVSGTRTVDGGSSIGIHTRWGRREYRALKYPGVWSTAPQLRAYARISFVRPGESGQVVQTIEGQCSNLAWRGVGQLAMDTVMEDFVRSWAGRDDEAHRQVWKSLKGS